MSVRPALPLLVVLATGLAPLTAIAPATAATDASEVVISEVYGGGGAASSTWQRDYVELYNPTDQPVDLAGTSVQYRSAGGTTNPSGVTALNGTIPAKGYFLVGGATGSAGAPVPAPQVSGSIAMSATAGTVFLADQASALTSPPTGSLTGNPAVLDVVGYGTSNTFEQAAAPAPSSSTALERDAAGTDTDDNSADLLLTPGTPGATPAGGGPTDPPTDPPTARTIAEIQGTGRRQPAGRDSRSSPREW